MNKVVVFVGSYNAYMQFYMNICMNRCIYAVLHEFMIQSLEVLYNVNFKMKFILCYQSHHNLKYQKGVRCNIYAFLLII